MNNSAPSLDRLHDIVMPAPIPWWPPAPGWYAVLAVLLMAAVWIAWRLWQRWLADSYRREALCLLSMAKDAATIAELLKRTALAIVPRQTVAAMTGHQWVDWLQASYPAAMPQVVREQLTGGIYSGGLQEQDFRVLREYAGGWIAGHRRDQVAAIRSN